MDGLSAAASGIAVISLALQLVDSVRQIQRFLRKVSEAPKELRRLIELLEQLELILESIGELINKQQQQGGNQDVAVSETVLRAMKNCENTVKGLASTVDGARKSIEARSKTTKTLACFRLSCKKRDIEEFERQIHEAVSLLNLTITTNLTAMHSKSIGNLLTQVMATNQITTTISQELVLLRNGPPTSSGQNCQGNLPTLGVGMKRSRMLSRSSSNNRSTESRVKTPLGTMIIRKHFSTATSSNGDEDSSVNYCTRDDNTWIFIPSFFSRCIDFRYSKTWGGIQGAFRTYPVLRNDHPVWNLIRLGDLRGIQKLFSERQLSPFSIDIHGHTLLDYSVCFYRWEIVKILFQIGLADSGLDLSRRYVIARPMPYLVSPWYNTGPSIRRLVVTTQDEADALEITYDLIKQHDDELDPCSFAAAFCSSDSFEPSIHLYRKMVNLFINKDNVNLLFSPISMAMRMLWNSEPTAQESWKEAIRYIISLGLDLHKNWRYSLGSPTLTVLDTILNVVDQPFESHWLGRKWLEILLESGIDVDEYLRVEFEMRRELSQTLFLMPPRYNTGYRNRFLIMSKEPPSVNWDWYIDPTGMAFDVLQEFKDFGTGSQDMAWPNYIGDWPFAYSEWQRIDYGIRHGREVPEVNMPRLRIRNHRYERREHKKAAKLARAQGLLRRGPKIPGAWID
ncbi:hypothetical protein V8E51_013308 [Hyaloscypha variabilis]